MDMSKLLPTGSRLLHRRDNHVSLHKALRYIENYHSAVLSYRYSLVNICGERVEAFNGARLRTHIDNLGIDTRVESIIVPFPIAVLIEYQDHIKSHAEEGTFRIILQCIDDLVSGHDYCGPAIAAKAKMLLEFKDRADEGFNLYSIWNPIDSEDGEEDQDEDGEEEDQDEDEEQDEQQDEEQDEEEDQDEQHDEEQDGEDEDGEKEDDEDGEQECIHCEAEDDDSSEDCSGCDGREDETDEEEDEIDEEEDEIDEEKEEEEDEEDTSERDSNESEDCDSDCDCKCDDYMKYSPREQPCSEEPSSKDGCSEGSSVQQPDIGESSVEQTTSTDLDEKPESSADECQSPSKSIVEQIGGFFMM